MPALSNSIWNAVGFQEILIGWMDLTKKEFSLIFDSFLKIKKWYEILLLF